MAEAGAPPAPGWAVLEREGVLARWGEWPDGPTGPAPSPSPFRVAGFDLNDTLVVSRRARPGYLLTAEDWDFFSPEVAPRLRALHEQGWLLAVFSNQGNIRRAFGGRRASAVREYVDAAVSAAGVPIHVFLATTQGPCRKPSAGMWGLLQDAAAALNGGVGLSAENSFYVGDALGEGGGRAEDLGFARAAGLRVSHPRDFFAAPAPGPGAPGEEKPPLPPRLVLVLVGLQGSGKTAFARELEGPGGAREWVRVSQDVLGSRGRCLEVTAQALGRGASVVVDRTNLDARQRAVWREAAAAAGADSHCLVFDHLSVETCAARVAARQDHEGGVEGARGRAICFQASARRGGYPPTEGFSRTRLLRGEAELAGEREYYRPGPSRGALPEPSRPV